MVICTYIYHLDGQVVCSKIAPWQNSSPGLQNSSSEFQKILFCFDVKGAIFQFRGAFLQSKGAILRGGYFAAQNLTVLTVCLIVARFKHLGLLPI